MLKPLPFEATLNPGTMEGGRSAFTLYGAHAVRVSQEHTSSAPFSLDLTWRVRSALASILIPPIGHNNHHSCLTKLCQTRPKDRADFRAPDHKAT